MGSTEPLGEAHIMPVCAVAQPPNHSKLGQRQPARRRSETINDEGDAVAGGGAARRRKAKPVIRGGKDDPKDGGMANAQGGGQPS